MNDGNFRAGIQSMFGRLPWDFGGTLAFFFADT
jgi:hypothetical protein